MAASRNGMVNCPNNPEAAPFDGGVVASAPGRLLLRELQFAVAGDHLDAVARFEFAEEELRSQRVQQVVLDGPLPLSTPGG